MKLVNKIIETYELEDGFFCEVSYEDDGTKELWICHKDVGIKELMVGMHIKDRGELENYIDVLWKEYAFIYSQNHMD